MNEPRGRWALARWAEDTVERVGATFAEAWAAVFSADQTDLAHLDWSRQLSVAGLAAAATLAKCVAARFRGNRSDASVRRG